MTKARPILVTPGDGGPQRIYRSPDLEELTGYHRDYIRALVREGRFPKPVPLGGPGGRAVGWLERDILEWQRQRIAERDGPSKPNA